ncbi:hydroxyacylglutathione hydrolase [Craterilacuibacter sp.]|uniref:hydroxyacylglutathione hydrolase n=1 Tax=Craterilacuibacter sp. TaxID=2870909 RepID=UPI003F31B0BE
MIDIHAIKAFSDNYIWVFATPTGICAVDPGDASPLFDWLNKNKQPLSAVLITHHHADHTGGLPRLRQHYPDLAIYGPPAIDGVTHIVGEGDAITFGTLKLDVIATPGHTLDHLAYLGEDFAFTGDTLFAAGCGRLFEGTPEMMYRSLLRLAALPDNTRIYPAHEYTVANLYFACACEPDNPAITARLAREQQCVSTGMPTVPSLLSTEKASNPFLRSSLAALATSASRHTGQATEAGIATFTILRQWKNDFIR